MLTAVQHKTYQFIKQFIDKYGYSPTTAEIAKGIKIKSRGVAYRYLSALAEKGLITLTPHRRRNIQLLTSATHQATTHQGLPLLGQIAAGSPIEAVPQQETVDVADLFYGRNRYALRVNGNSMVEEGIFDGDIVICERRVTAQNGQIVVALIDNEYATLKRLLHNSDKSVTLLPANSDHLPQTYSPERVQIQGIFIGLLRYNGI